MSQQTASSPEPSFPEPGSVELSEKVFRELDPGATPFFLLRYGEIGLKSRPVKQRFLSMLEQNLLRRFAEQGFSPVVSREQGRLYLFCDDIGTAARLLRTTPGIVSFSLCHQAGAELEEILATFARIAALHLEEGDSFAIRARRVGSHPYTSQELGRLGGERVLDRSPEKKLSVNLGNPQKPLFVEVRGQRSFFYLGSEPGVGGFPVGVAGAAISLPGPELKTTPSLLMMRRGCRVYPVIPEEGLHSGTELKGLEEELDRYHVGTRTHVFSSGGGEPLLHFLRKRKIQGVVLPHDTAGLDALMKETGSGKELRLRLLEEAGLAGKELLEHCLSLPFFFPLLGGLSSLERL